MKTLVEYLNESKEDVQRFKIDNLKDELESNRVSKSRISEIIKYFKTVLGDGPYYCVSYGNIAGKETLPIVKRAGFFRISLTELYDLNLLKDSAEYDDMRAEWKKHNEEVKSFTKEKIDRILDMEKNIDLSIRPFQYGKYDRHSRMYLSAAIAKYKGEYIPVIIQKEDTTQISWNDVLKGLDTTLYVACKDID